MAQYLTQPAYPPQCILRGEPAICISIPQGDPRLSSYPSWERSRNCLGEWIAYHEERCERHVSTVEKCSVARYVDGPPEGQVGPVGKLCAMCKRWNLERAERVRRLYAGEEE